MSDETIHATTVAIDGRGVAIMGASGSGKSDLALRLIDRGAALVSDDYTIVSDGAVASAPATIAGRIEVRGIGIVAMPAIERATIALVVRLEDESVRMPEAGTYRLGGAAVPMVAIDPRTSAAPIKVEIALRELAR